MLNLRTHETELFGVLTTIMEKAQKVPVGSEIDRVQDAILTLRVDWEELQSRLRNRKIDGFELIVDAMLQLAASTMMMAAALQSKIINQRIRQMQIEEAQEVTTVSKKVKKKRKIKL